MNRNDLGVSLSCFRLVDALHGALNQIAFVDQNRFGEPFGDGKWKPLPDTPSHNDRHDQQHIADVVVGLDRELANEGFDVRYSEAELSPNERWNLSLITHICPIRKTVRGFVEPVYRARVVQQVPARVVAFLVEIPGWDDLLEQECHSGVGWHYHYINEKRERSDIILCWDTIWPNTNGVRPLFQETHGKSHARFRGRPDMWGNEKRRSMYNACAPDLHKRSIKEFRCASAKSGPVWPLSAVLTPKPSGSAKKIRKGSK